LLVGGAGLEHIAVGLITDERATPEQQQALVQIGSGQGGGPMAALGPLVGKLLGVEAKPIRFEGQGMRYSVSAPGMLDQAIEGVPSAVKAGEPLYIDNTAHPANARLALAKATRAICTRSESTGTRAAVGTTVTSHLLPGA
jgi:hypothetical protein